MDLIIFGQSNVLKIFFRKNIFIYSEYLTKYFRYLSKSKFNLGLMQYLIFALTLFAIEKYTLTVQKN